MSDEAGRSGRSAVASGDEGAPWVTARPGVRQFASEMYRRKSLERLQAHIEEVHATGVSRIEQLDLGVFRVDRGDDLSWVARVFASSRPPERVAGDAETLRFLAGRGYPAERCATEEPVSLLDGQGVLVTEFVPPVPRQARADAIRGFGGFRTLGEMLGRLHRLPVAATEDAPSGGCWHHLGDGGPGEELAAAGRLLAMSGDVASSSERKLRIALENALGDCDAADGLPEALVHPDFVLPNVIASEGRGLVLVDWTGAGRAARLWSLAFLLFSAGARGGPRLDRVVAGYSEHVRLEPEELARLAKVMLARPVVLEIWAYCMGRKTLEEAAHAVLQAAELAEAVAGHAVDHFRQAPEPRR